MPIKIDEVVKFVTENLKNVHSTSDVARHFGRASQTINRAFEMKRRIPLREFIRQEKVERMKQLLRVSDLSCKEICYEVGYRMDYGARVFKEEAGMTMGQFRQVNRDGGFFWGGGEKDGSD